MKLSFARVPALLFAIFAVAAGCKEHAQSLAMPARPPARVAVTPATTQDVPLYIEEIGRTAAIESVTIQPQVTGTVFEINFKDGQMVKKGDLLFLIDPRPFEAALAAAQAQLAQDLANVKWAQSEYQRMLGLEKTGAVSTSDIENKQNLLAVAEAKIKGSDAAIQKAKLDREYCTIRSPIDGRTGQHLVDIGNVVNAGGPDGGTKMLSIQRTVPIYADFTVNEESLEQVRKHMTDHPLSAQVWLPGEQNDPRTGQLTFLDNAVQQGSGTIKLRATLDNKDNHFWPNQFCQVRLILQTIKDAVLVPNNAVQIGQDGNFVFVVKDDSTAEQRPVNVGQRQGELVVIAKGVAPGEKVITQGQMAVIPGSKVSVIPQAPPQQQASR
jgi:membrane fusion protein, multidrug efflux system